LIYIFLIGAVLIFGYSHFARAEAARNHQAFVARAKAAQEWINSVDTLPVIQPEGVALQKGELCYWAGPCSWRELRGRTQRIAYHGPSVSIPIVKGVRYRLGSISPTIVRTTELQEIDSGTLFITNKRLFFDGRAKNTTITYKAVAALKLFDGGFEVDKQTGRSPHLFVGPEPEQVAAMAVRAHADWAAAG